MKIIEGLEVKDNGKFFAWDGTEIPWWMTKNAGMDTVF